MKIGIIGNGFVGQATYLLKGPNVDMYIYDIDPKKCIPSNLKISDLNECEIIFICVPTPMNKDGSCYINIVKNVINSLKDFNNSFLVLRSTVPPSTSDELNVFFMPEFLTERNWLEDFINCQNWIFGLTLDNEKNEKFKKIINKLMLIAYNNKSIKYNNIHFIRNKEAEMVKYFRNVMGAVNVSLCNEFFNFCSSKNIDYDIVRSKATLDSRLPSYFTRVPGPDGQKGFGGTCFPKDTNSLLYEMKKNNVKPLILEAVIKRNNEIDRPNDIQEIGRGII
jgi:UDPglucose 6-dehydrogenase